MFSGYTLKRDEKVDNLLQQTLKASTEMPKISSRPLPWLEAIAVKEDDNVRVNREIVKIEFKFYNSARPDAVKKMAELYTAWKLTIAHMNMDDSGRELHELVNLGVPEVRGIIADIVVDTWQLEQVYPHEVSYEISLDSRQGKLTVALYGKVMELF